MEAASLVEDNRSGKPGLFVLLSLIVSLPIVFWLGRLQVQRLEAVQLQQSDHLGLLVAREVASEIGRVVDDYAYAVEALSAQVQARGSLDPTMLQKMVGAQRESFLPFASNMFISSAGGEILVVDPHQDPSGISDVGASIRERNDYQEAVRAGKIAISHAEIERNSRMPVVQMAAPIRDAQGNLWALAGGSLDMSSIQPHVEQIITGVPELEVAVMNEEGDLIVHSDKNAIDGIGDLSKIALFQPSRSGEDIRAGADEKGTSSRAAVVSILERGMNWRVIAYRPESYIKAQADPAKKKIFFLIGAGLMTGLLFTGLAFWFEQKKPLETRFSVPMQTVSLMVLVLFICLPVGLLGHLQIQFLESVQIDQMDQEGMLAAKVISRNIGQQIDRSVRVIESLAGQVRAQGGLESKAILQKIVTTQRAFFPGFTLMYIGNAEGFSVSSDPPFDKFGMPLAGTDYRDRDYYQAVARTGKSFVGPVRVGRRSHVPNIQIGSPVHDDQGKFWAFAEGSVDLIDNISPQVERLVAGIPELTAVVMDKEGRVVAHPEKEARQEIRDLSKFSLFRPTERSEGEVKTDINERGVPVRAVAAPILTRDLNWRVVVYRPEAYLHAQTAVAQRNTWMMVAIGLLPGLLFVVLSIFGMKKNTLSNLASPQYHA